MADPTKLTGTRPVQVWDAAIRIFHWLLVALIAFMWWSGSQKGDWLNYHF